MDNDGYAVYLGKLGGSRYRQENDRKWEPDVDYEPTGFIYRRRDPEADYESTGSISIRGYNKSSRYHKGSSKRNFHPAKYTDSVNIT